MKFKHEIKKKLKQKGIKLLWFSNQFLPTPRTTFWRKFNSDTLTKEEKEKIKSIVK